MPDADTVENDELYHYGILRRSGRYPWGSGETPEERSRSYLGYVNELKAKGLSDAEVARALDITDERGRPSSSVVRAARAIALNEVKQANISQALRLHEKGMSNVAIGKRMGIPESSVRALLNPALTAKADILKTTANLLESKVDADHYLDIGLGTANHLGISATKLSNAVAILKEKGYAVHNVQAPQLTGKNKTTVKVLAPPGTKYVDIVKNMDKIKTAAGAYSEDGGRTYQEIKPPVNIDSKRLSVVHAEEGGGKADGVIYLRPGVPDLSLGGNRYAQVRIAVDGTHYLKGMAMYKPNLPKGVDLEFHTSKKNTGNKLDALKAQKDVAPGENPFGAVVRQRHYKDPVTGEEKLSPLNIVNEEGKWKDWSRTLSSQFLSKQSVGLVRQQLGFTLESRQRDLEEIMSLTNPVVKNRLLKEFADNADSAAVHLKAAALPRQATRVILPFEDMKETEVYAPSFNNGEKVALVRFPHGGTFEIPELTVNNRHAGARAALGADAQDAIGIHPNVAGRLSGADFDGDSVIVIPNNRRQVTTSAPLKGLKDFDPKTHYPPYDGMKTVDGGTYNAQTKTVDYGGKKPNPSHMQKEMGKVSNLITDMTVKGAGPDELARAVRHSMVVIDSEKHSLDYKRSEDENGIKQLKERYQGRSTAGAATVISNSGTKATVRVPERRLRKAAQGGPIDPETGEKVYVETGRQYVKDGKTIKVTTPVPKLALTKDAHEYSSGMPVEELYASHSNALKQLANTARRASLHTGKIVQSPSAAKTYADQVSSLNAKLDLALRNKPLERQAQLVAGVKANARIADNPHLDDDDKNKIKRQELMSARARLGVENQDIKIEPKEWEAIQAGAISTSKLNDILDNADMESVRKLATPRTATVMTPAKLAIAKARLNSGYTQAEVAESLGVPVSTLNSALLR